VWDATLVRRLHCPRAEREYLLVERNELVMQVGATQEVLERVQVHYLAVHTRLSMSRWGFQHLRDMLLEAIESTTIPLDAGIHDRFLRGAIVLQVVDPTLNIEKDVIVPFLEAEQSF